MSGIFFRLLLKAFVPVVMLMSIMSYMLHMQGKDPMMPFTNASKNMGGAFVSATGSFKDGVAGVMPGSSDTTPMSAERVYRWVDKDGLTHFGTFKPDEQVAFETIRVNPNHNIMDPFQAPVPQTTEVVASGEPVVSAPPISAPAMSANPAEIKKMLQNIENVNNSRLQQLQSIQ